MKENRRPVCQSAWFVRTLLVLLLVLTPLATVNRSVAQPPPDMPLQFKMIGEFYDPEKDPEKGGVNAFTVNVEKRTWIFDIESSHTLEGDALGSSVLKKIYPPIMTFVGPKELIQQLINPEIAGRSFILMGQLYITKRMFRLTDVQGREQQGASGADPEVESDTEAAPPAPN